MSQRRFGQDKRYNDGTKFISRRDFLVMARLPVFFAAAWLLPVKLLVEYGRRLSRLRSRVRPASVAREVKRLRWVLPDAGGAALDQDFHAHFYLEWLLLFRLHRPFAKPLPTRLEGREHLDAALARGKGAIVWVMPTVYHSLATKVAFWNEGVRLAHLSRTDHGFSNTRFGERVLNPLRIRVEQRFLGKRIVINPARMNDALAELQHRLERNEVVSITVGHRASKVLSVPLLDAQINVATRPIELARQTGAAILPVVTVLEPDLTYRTVIGPSLLPQSDTSTEAAGAALAAFTEPHARSSPAQFVDLIFVPRGS